MELIPDTLDLTAYMEERPAEHRVLPASDWTKEVSDYFHRPDSTPKVRLPWKKTHGDFHLRPSEVTLWGGINGHGKSQIVGHVMNHIAEQGQRIAMASLEMKPAITMARMVRQAYGNDFPPIDYIEKYGKWTDGKFWIYDHFGSINAKTMLAVIRYAVDNFAVQHFVIDNLAKCGMGEDDYNGQKMFLDSLTAIAKDTGCHVHLVLHVKKGKSEFDMPNKFDIRGAGALTDMPDNCFIVWRNKEKESKIRSNEDFSPDDPDCILQLVKQRHGETEGAYRLYFDRKSMQYMEVRTDHPTHNRAETGIEAHEIEF